MSIAAIMSGEELQTAPGIKIDNDHLFMTIYLSGSLH
jgi:hypothetical protein